MGHVHAWVECVFWTVSECAVFSLCDVCMTALQFVFGKRNPNVAKYLAEQAARIGRIACGVQLCRALVQMPINEIQTPESPVYAGINEFFIINPGDRVRCGPRFYH